MLARFMINQYAHVSFEKHVNVLLRDRHFILMPVRSNLVQTVTWLNIKVQLSLWLLSQVLLRRRFYNALAIHLVPCCEV